VAVPRRGTSGKGGFKIPSLRKIGWGREEWDSTGKAEEAGTDLLRSKTNKGEGKEKSLQSCHWWGILQEGGLKKKKKVGRVQGDAP